MGVLSQTWGSLHSDMEKTQELIDELEDFFMKTEGAPTVVDDQEMKMVIPEPIMESNNNLTMGDPEQAVTTNMTTEDGQNVIIIIAPSSPSDSVVSSLPGQSSMSDQAKEEVRQIQTSQGTCWTVSNRQEGKEEGTEQNRSLQVQREDEVSAGHCRGGAGGTGGEE